MCLWYDIIVFMKHQNVEEGVQKAARALIVVSWSPRVHRGSLTVQRQRGQGAEASM